MRKLEASWLDRQMRRKRTQATKKTALGLEIMKLLLCLRTLMELLNGCHQPYRTKKYRRSFKKKGGRNLDLVTINRV